MKFHAVFAALFLSWTWVDSSPLDSATDASPSSRLDTDSNNFVVNSDTHLYENIDDGVRRLKKGKVAKNIKKTNKVKRTAKKGKKGKKTSAPFGALLNKPHRLEYEKHDLCIPGVNMYGCGDGADVSNGGKHIHAVIMGRRHVKHSGVFVAKSRCDYTDEILDGTPPDFTIQPQTSQDGSSHLYRTHPKREEDCKQNRRTTSSSAMMHDPNDHFEYDAIVFENSIKYKKYIARVYDMATTDKQKPIIHLLQAGLTPDTIVYLEDMDGKPYVIRSYNGANLLHQTKVTKFELLTTADQAKSADEIKTDSAGKKPTRHLIPQPNPTDEISTYNGRDLQEYTLNYIPPFCDAESPLCLTIGNLVSSDSIGFKIDFNLNIDMVGVQLEAGYTTNNDYTLATAEASATGCVELGITGELTLSISLCLEGGFSYDKKAGDADPGVESYEVDMSIAVQAGILSEHLTLAKVDGKFTMLVQNSFFIGYEGSLTRSFDIKIASASFGLEVDYRTPSYRQYFEPDGWATKVFTPVTFGIDFYFWTDTHSYNHVFHCEPSINTLCGGAGDPNPPLPIPHEMSENDSLLSGHALISKNGAYTLMMQSDGNLVLYNISNGMTVLWASQTFKDSIKEVIFQTDSNFVMYGTDGGAPWASGTYGTSAATIIMQDDGKVVMYDTSGTSVWQIP